MATKCNCFEDTRGFIITGVFTILGICLYAILIGVFYLKNFGDFGLYVMWILFSLECLTIIFQSIYFGVQDGATMLANSIVYMITMIAETGLIVGFVIWSAVNRNENIEGCPVCGDRKNTISQFFFWAGFAAWMVIGLSIKIASAINFQKYYDERFKGVEITYSLGSKHAPEEEVTLVVIK